MLIRKMTHEDLPSAAALCQEALLFVAPLWQRRGVGKRLVNAALEQARADVVTVRASLSSVAAYEGYGFALAGEEGEFAGLIYQPMEKRLSL
ncbi:GNAT family N-acetyltransferase [Pseudomonas protegens]|nr:GNAT family N-acetyltransferase [Pseudomonas protegens]QZI73322.1 GNAT family N-acetyltransferase [Pseudomonas protegens]